MKPGHAIAVRPCSTHEEFHECVGLQRAVWRFADLEIVAADLLMVAAKTGGQVFGAFDAEHMVGFSYAVPALRAGAAYLHSHMVAVLPDYRDRGIGRQLKLAQREEALGRNINLIEWTFDPLEIKNAHFNIARLGVVVRRYEVDLYGVTSSPLHRNMPTDRLVAEWRLDSERVKGALASREQQEVLGERSLTFPTPTSSNAREVQSKLRREFQEAFSQGLAVTGFERDEGKGTYWLGREV